MKMQECWNSLRSPIDVKSIMGLVPEYSHIVQILDNETYDNPSLNYALYQSDSQTLDHLKTVIIVMRKKLIDEIIKLLCDI